jgi:hypothetical protein
VIEAIDVERHDPAAMTAGRDQGLLRASVAKARANRLPSPIFSNTTLTPRPSVMRMTSAVKSVAR